MDGLTVGGLAERYSEFAEGYYRKHGRPATEVQHIRSMLVTVVKLYGEELVVGFGPLKLKAVRKVWVDGGLVRVQVNKRVDRVRRMFAWGVEEELVRVEVLIALRTVRGLSAGRSAAKESVKVRPVSDAHVDAIRPFVGRRIWAMIELQRWSGIRPGEVCVIRTTDVAVKDGVWEYRPAEHKMEHADRERVVYLGPRAQAVMRPWLRLVLEEYLFSPREALSERAKAPPLESKDACPAVATGSSQGVSGARACGVLLEGELRPGDRQGLRPGRGAPLGPESVAALGGDPGPQCDGFGGLPGRSRPLQGRCDPDLRRARCRARQAGHGAARLTARRRS